jgi:hypothetical protein
MGRYWSFHSGWPHRYLSGHPGQTTLKNREAALALTRFPITGEGCVEASLGVNRAGIPYIEHIALKSFILVPRY